MCHRYQQHQWHQFAVDVADYQGNFAIGVVDTGGKFATGVVDTGGAPWLANIFANFLRKMIHEKNQKKTKNLVTLSL